MAEQDPSTVGQHHGVITDECEEPQNYVIVLSQKTYHKNHFISRLINKKIDLHREENKVNEYEAEQFTIVNMPGMFDTDPDNVPAVKKTIEDFLQDHNHQVTFCIMLFVHPIRWTGEDQDFVHTVKQLVGEKMFKTNTFIVIADYNTREMPLDEYVSDIIADYSSGFFITPKNKLGDLFKLISTEKIFYSEYVTERFKTSKFSTFLDIDESKTKRVRDKQKQGNWMTQLLGKLVKKN